MGLPLVPHLAQYASLLRPTRIDTEVFWRTLTQRLQAEGGEVVANCHGLKLTASDGKQRGSACVNMETLFRIIHPAE